jgi:hypothetical protein
MCIGGRLVADFTAGTEQAPDVPDVVRAALTLTTDGKWVVWARKLARPARGGYQPLSSAVPYPADAVAQCRRSPEHNAPLPYCTCGFHALSEPGGRNALVGMLSFGMAGRPLPVGAAPDIVALEVALSGRVVAQEWRSGGLLFRAARQTVVRIIDDPARPTQPELDDPGAVLARLIAPQPRGQGPRRLTLPSATPPAVTVDDHVGLCAARRVTLRPAAQEPALA